MISQGLSMKLLFLILLLSSCAQIPRSEKIVIAHRGASAYLPEHTLEAYAMAHAMNVDYIEPDLVMSKDNHIVILHDIELDTTTNVASIYPKRARKDGHYYAIDFTLAELKTLSVSERSGADKKAKYPKRFPKNKSSFKIPTFVEFIELVQGLNKSRNKSIGIIPEIKKPEFHLKNGKDITKAAYLILKKYGYEENDQAIVQSFYPPTLKRFKNEFKSKIKLAQLIAENSWGESTVDYNQLMTKEGVFEISKYAYAISPWYPQIKKHHLSSKAKKNNLKLITYTHRPEEIPPGMSQSMFLNELFIDFKIDGLFSDAPDVVIKHLKSE